MKALERLRDIGRHESALRVAMGEFGDSFDLGEFRSAFESTDPILLNRVNAVERGVDRLYNYMAELIAFGLELAGERVPTDDVNAARDLRELRRQKVFSRDRTESLQRLRELRRLMVHEYPQATADQIHEAAQLIVAILPAFTHAYVRWVKAGFRPPADSA